MRFRVSGMSCDSCAQALTQAIRKAAPDATVDIDLTSGEVAVEGRVAECAIAAAIQRAGYMNEGRLD
jgi:copper chaperone